MEKNDNLAHRRKALGLSQSQLADMLGMTQASVSRNETAPAPDLRFVLALEAIEARHRATYQPHPKPDRSAAA